MFLFPFLFSLPNLHYMFFLFWSPPPKSPFFVQYSSPVFLLCTQKYGLKCRFPILLLSSLHHAPDHFPPLILPHYLSLILFPSFIACSCYPNTSLFVGPLAVLICQGKLRSELCYSKILLEVIKSSQFDLRVAGEYSPGLRALLGYCIAMPPDPVTQSVARMCALKWMCLQLGILTHVKYSVFWSTFRKARKPLGWHVKYELLVLGTQFPAPQVLCNVKS